MTLERLIILENQFYQTTADKNQQSFDEFSYVNTPLVQNCIQMKAL